MTLAVPDDRNTTLFKFLTANLYKENRRPGGVFQRGHTYNKEAVTHCLPCAHRVGEGSIGARQQISALGLCERLIRP